MHDPQLSKRRDLRRRARADWGTSKLFKIYNPEYSDKPRWIGLYCDCEAWHRYYNAEHNWMIRLAGHWSAIGCSMPSYVRHDANRLTRTRQKAALRQAIHDDALEDFAIQPQKHTIRWDWW